MNEQARLKRNAERLTELYDPFAARILALIGQLEALGYRPRIQEAFRSPADQLAAYNSGHSSLRFGFHNTTSPNGAAEALAVDLLDDDRPLSPPTSYVLRLAALARSQGLQTGLLWGLTARHRQTVEAALAAEDWNASVRIGWDPLHIEPQGITIREAKAGKRPILKAPASPAPASQDPRPYIVRFAGADHPLEAPVFKDRAWLPIRIWGERTGQAVVWQGEGLPILLGGRPYSGEIDLIGEQAHSPVRELAAFAGLELQVDTANRTITVLS